MQAPKRIKEKQNHEIASAVLGLIDSLPDTPHIRSEPFPKLFDVGQIELFGRLDESALNSRNAGVASKVTPRRKSHQTRMLTPLRALN
jgi:hypothetical protein